MCIKNGIHALGDDRARVCLNHGTMGSLAQWVEQLAVNRKGFRSLERYLGGALLVIATVSSSAVDP